MCFACSQQRSLFFGLVCRCRSLRREKLRLHHRICALTRLRGECRAHVIAGAAAVAVAAEGS
eukprot:3117329-Prymnesium_polylepis.3